jgi:hypothetical protein
LFGIGIFLIIRRTVMFNTEKSKLRTENERLSQRVKDLEFRICKGKHDYVKTGESTTNVVGFDFEVSYEYICLNCGKKYFI